MNIYILLEEFCEYSTYIKGLSPKTIKRYKQQIHFFAFYNQIEYLEQVTEPIMQQFFLKGRIHRKWKTRTYHTYYMSLQSFFKWCMKHNYTSNNPLQIIELPKLEKRIPKKLKKEEAFKLLELVYNYPYTQDFVRYRNYAIFAMFLHTGLRKNELLNLKMTDVDTENQTLFVRQGKGNKDRIIPINFTLTHILQRYLVERKKQKKTCSEFFVCSNRNRGFGESGLKTFLDGFKKTTGLKFTIHQLRHTFATLMLEGGCDIYSLSKMMGHSDIKTTTIYLSASPEHLRHQVIKHPLNH